MYNYNESEVKKLNVAICDDNKIFRDQLFARLSLIDFFKDGNYTFYENGSALVNALSPSAPFDFVFLDVDMPEMDGIEAGKRIYECSPKTIIIFISNYPQYAIEAFDCNATSYLLKEYSEERFLSTVHKAIEKYKALNAVIPLKTGSGIVNLAPTEIFYVEYTRKYCVYYTEKEVYRVRQPLQDALKPLSPFGFLQIYQCFIINLAKIKEIHSSGVTLTNNVELPIRRGFSGDVIKAYVRYRREQL
jgi:DNA-binding LytR/AlgR family response regulator